MCVYIHESNEQTAIAMTNYNDFIRQTMMNYASLENTIRKQAYQMEILKTKNNELEMMVGFLRDRLVECDPSMKAKLEFLSFR